MRYNFDFLPTPGQELLLQALLLRHDDAMSAYQQWRAIYDIEKLDPASVRLLPLLYRHLSKPEVGIEDADLDRLMGVYRITWYKNQVLFRSAADVLRMFHDSGIETLLLKGAAATMLNYKDNGVRPMDDVDVLVRLADAQRAMQLLLDSGWEPGQTAPEIRWPVRNSIGFKAKDGPSVDLHWHVLRECCLPGDDEDFWVGSVQVDFNGVPSRALNATDQLLHICVHGAHWNVMPGIRWVADALYTINAAHTEIDWDRLLAQAVNRRLTLHLSNTLSYLHNTFNASVHSVVLSRLATEPTSRLERFEFEINTHAHDNWKFMLMHWFVHARQVKKHEWARKVFGYPTYFRQAMGLSSMWQVPVHIVSEVFRKYVKEALQGRKTKGPSADTK